MLIRRNIGSGVLDVIVLGMKGTILPEKHSVSRLVLNIVAALLIWLVVWLVSRLVCTVFE